MSRTLIIFGSSHVQQKEIKKIVNSKKRFVFKKCIALSHVIEQTLHLKVFESIVRQSNL